MNEEESVRYDSDLCRNGINAIRDALYVLNGKWKLPIIAGLAEGPKRFNELHRLLGDITPKALSKELRELELNELVKRTVFIGRQPTVTYEMTRYSSTLGEVLTSLRTWGEEHKQHILSSRRSKVLQQ